MPKFEVTSPDGKVYEITAPEGATEQQVIEYAQQVHAAETTQPTQTQPAQAPSDQSAPNDYRSESLKQSAELARQAVAEPLNRALGLAGRAVAEGALGTVGLVSDPITALINQYIPENDPKLLYARDLGSKLSDVLGFSKPETQSERIVQSATEAVAGGVPLIKAGQALAKTAQPIAQKVGQVLSAAPGAQAISAAAGGAAAQGVTEAGGTPMGALGASLAAGLAAPAAMSKTQTALNLLRSAGRNVENVSPEIANLLQQAQNQGVDILTTDIFQPQTAIGKIGQRIGERVPFAGTGGIRKTQQAQRVQAIQNLVDEYGAVDTTDIGKQIFEDIAKKRSAELENFKKQKHDVINKFSDQGVVPLNNTLSKLEEQIVTLRNQRTESANEAANILEKFKSSDISGLIGRNLPELENFRRDVLAKVFEDDPASPISIAAREIGDKAIRSLYNPLKEDMGNFIKDVGGQQDVTKWKMANANLSKLADETQVSSFRKLLQQGNATPELVENMFLGKKPSEVQRVYQALTPNGQMKAKTLLINKIAFSPDGSIKSPEKFNNELKRYGANLDVIFQGDEAKRLKGLSRVLDVTKRASEAGVVTASGQETMPFVAGTLLTDLFGSAGAATAAAGGIGLTGRVYESKPIRNLLIKMNATRPGSKAEKELARTIVRTANTIYQSQQSLQDNQQQQTGMQ